MPEMIVNFEVYCGRHHIGMCSDTTVKGLKIFIDTPCEKCLDEAREEGYDEGYKNAQDTYGDGPSQ